jgi:hypothetical protein
MTPSSRVSSLPSAFQGADEILKKKKYQLRNKNK